MAYTAVTSQSPCSQGRQLQPDQHRLRHLLQRRSELVDPDVSRELGLLERGEVSELVAAGAGGPRGRHAGAGLRGVQPHRRTLPPFWNTAVPPVSRLVLTESSNGGSSWSVPQVLNVSTNPAYSGVYFAPALPTLATSGNTIYLAWERLGAPDDTRRRTRRSRCWSPRRAGRRGARRSP